MNVVKDRALRNVFMVLRLKYKKDVILLANAELEQRKLLNKKSLKTDFGNNILNEDVKENETRHKVIMQ